MSLLARTVLIAASLCGCALLGSQLAFPFPLKLSGGTRMQRLDAKASYYWQCFQHIIGYRDHFDKAWLQSKYEKLLPNGANWESMSSSPSLGKVDEIDAYSDPNWLEKFNKLYRDQAASLRRPVVVRGLTRVDTEGFADTGAWTVESFRQIYKNRSIPVFTDCWTDQSVVYMPFDTFLSELQDTSLVRYARCVRIGNELEDAGFNNTHLAAIMRRSMIHKMNIVANGDDTTCSFIGGKHVKSRLHSDWGVSAFVEFQGSKRWVFFPPSEAALLWPHGHRHNLAYNADVDIFNPDLKANYLLGAATGFEVVINAGDVLFFPSFWWHAVENLDDLTVAIDFAVVDFLAPWVNQAILQAGSQFNWNTIRKVMYARFVLEPGAIRDVFFSGYAKPQKGNSRDEV